MRVAIDATALLGHPTGVGVVTRELVAGLGQRATPTHPDTGRDTIEVRLFVVSWRGRHDLKRLAPPGTIASTRPVPARVARSLWPRVNVPPISWLTGPVDVVHGPNFVVPPGALRPGRGGAREVVTIHDMTFLHFPDFCTDDTRTYRSLIRRALARGAHVHAVSRFVGDEVIEAFDLTGERVTVIPNGVRALGEGDARPGRQIAGGELYVLALGTVEPRKDLPSLVRAFDSLAAERRDLRLVLAGPDGWGARALTNAVSASPHRDRIVRLGWVSDEHRAALLRGASVLAYPSRYEGFGLPPLEAMSAGVPVVATDVGALRETVGDAALLVPVGDADALAEAVGRVLDDAALAGDLRARGHARVAGFSWDATVESMIGLYRRLNRG